MVKMAHLAPQRESEEAANRTIDVKIKDKSFRTALAALQHSASCLGEDSRQAYKDAEQDFRQAAGQRGGGGITTE